VISSQKYSHSKYEPVILIKKRIQNQYTQLADDTTLVYKIGKEIKEAIEIINELGTCSGLKLNIKKTEWQWLGRNKTRNINIVTVCFCYNTVKALGVYFLHVYIRTLSCVQHIFTFILHERTTFRDLWVGGV